MFDAHMLSRHIVCYTNVHRVIDKPAAPVRPTAIPRILPRVCQWWISQGDTVNSWYARKYAQVWKSASHLGRTSDAGMLRRRITPSHQADKT
ncbi:dynamin GTPase, putative [Aspergillus lentulus]|nr:dynamin GTPase, putative [Aspergillus lentulus]